MYIYKLVNVNASVITVGATATNLLSLLDTAASASNNLTNVGLNGVDLMLENGDVRMMMDGNTPTAEKGILLKANTLYAFRNVPVNKIRLIRTSGDVAISVQVGKCQESESSNAAAITAWTDNGTSLVPRASRSIRAFGATFLSHLGAIADGANAIANRTGNANALSTSTTKIHAWYSDNFVTEKASIDYLGLFAFGKGSIDTRDLFKGTVSGNSSVLTMKSLNGDNGFSFSSVKTAAGLTTAEIMASGWTGLLTGGAASSASAIGWVVRTASNYTHSGADIVAFYNLDTKKAEIDKDGIIIAETNKRVACGGGSTGATTTPNGTVTLEINGTSYFLLKAAAA